MAKASKKRAAGSAKERATVKTTVKKGAPKAPKAKVAAAKPVGESKEVIKAKQALKKAVQEPPPAEPAKAAVPKVSEAKGKGRKAAVAASLGEATSALAQKWSSLFKKAEQIESQPYNMKGVFAEKTAIVHKVLGWGYILANRNDRLEVLFKDGIKYLISNYKA